DAEQSPSAEVSEAEHAGVLRQVRESRADVLFVGMGTPFKEVWCHRHREELATPVVIPVGGSFDVLAGFVRRAPRWMQRVGLEWFWRFLMEPRRMWKRYLTTNTRFIALVCRELFRRHTAPPRQPRTTKFDCRSQCQQRDRVSLSRRT
ncbi:MAG: WecB/TagA/CpsF family glycosyltransferase, partial [Planctomycetes bacterium]|nr:WecB/TagA/CpsF family glycosyltransferase [Planctomycetota bacterium]